MRRIKMRMLRSILFLLLGLVFAVLAVVEGIPKAQQSAYSQVDLFTVTSQKTEEGYSYFIEGSIKNDSKRSEFLDLIVVRFANQYGEDLSMEFEIGNMAPGEVRKLSGSMTGDSPATKVICVSTSALMGDIQILAPESGLQFTKGFLILAVLALLSFAAAVFFAVNGIKHSHHHHHHHHHKSETSESKTD